jgi:hypothetical protein
MTSRKITMKDITTGSRQLLHDLRDLQKTGLTIPDIIYSYRIVDGRLERKRYREGSQSGDEEVEPVDVQVNNFLNAKVESNPNGSKISNPGLQAGGTSYRGPIPGLYSSSPPNERRAPSPGPNLRLDTNSNAQMTSNAATIPSSAPPPYSDPLSNPRPELPPRPTSSSNAASNQTPMSTSIPIPISSTSSNPPPDVSSEAKAEKRISRKPLPKREEELKQEQPTEDDSGEHKEKHVKFGSIRVIGDGAKGRRLVGDEGAEDS